MKNLKLLWLLLLMGCFKLSVAQGVDTDEVFTKPEFSGLQLSIRGGYDFPLYDFDNQYIDYKGGIMAGASLDYYWNWFGMGADFDYIQNKPKNTFPTTGLKDMYEYPMNQFDLLENKVTRLFYGIGPDFRFLRSQNGALELKLRAGLSSIKGGETRLMGGSTEAQAAPPILLNYHGGFDKEKSVFAAKGSLQYSYFFSKHVGFNVGGYFLYHNKVKDLKSAAEGITEGHQDLASKLPLRAADLISRVDPIQKNMMSVGAFAGLNFRFNKRVKLAPVLPAAPPEVKHCKITVTAYDKYTKELLSGVQVDLNTVSGTALMSLVTDQQGKVVFEPVTAGDYTVAGSMGDKTLEGALVAESEFAACATTGGIQKEVLLDNPNFAIHGKVVNCDSNVVIPQAVVMVTDRITGKISTYQADDKGEFSFVATAHTSYQIYGKKANYLSQNLNFSTDDYDRKKSKDIQIMICMEHAGCNDAVVLKNILYDLDKSFIREDAKPELNRLVQFMKDNPEVRVELSSHTDSRGSDSYNMKLSGRRAQAAVDYIISQGIARSRLIAKGYGESRPVNGCVNGVPCSEADHQLNRRTEMKVVCPDSK